MALKCLCRKTFGFDDKSSKIKGIGFVFYFVGNETNIEDDGEDYEP